MHVGLVHLVSLLFLLVLGLAAYKRNGKTS
jgi:hypothetical protein